MRTAVGSFLIFVRVTPNSYKTFQRTLGVRTGLAPELEDE
jgi:hypothetical protein